MSQRKEGKRPQALRGETNCTKNCAMFVHFSPPSSYSSSALPARIQSTGGAHIVSGSCSLWTTGNQKKKERKKSARATTQRTCLCIKSRSFSPIWLPNTLLPVTVQKPKQISAAISVDARIRTKTVLTSEASIKTNSHKMTNFFHWRLLRLATETSVCWKFFNGQKWTVPAWLLVGEDRP